MKDLTFQGNTNKNRFFLRIIKIFFSSPNVDKESGWFFSPKVNLIHFLLSSLSLTFVLFLFAGGFLRKRREASQRFAQKNNLPLLNNVTLPRQGAMKTIIDCLGQHDEDLTTTQPQSTPPSSMKNINKVLNGDSDEFYIDNEYSNQQTPPDTPLRNAYNANNHGSNGDNNHTRNLQRIIDDDENLKEKMGEAEISSKKTLKYVVDITIAYPDRKPLDLGEIVTGTRRACQTHLLYRVYRCSEVTYLIYFTVTFYNLCFLGPT